MSFPAFFMLFPLIIVPIIIHLLSRKKLEKIDFPSLLFIIKNEIKLIRWFQLKRLLLLITRISLLIFLILAAVNLKVPFSFFNPAKTLILDNSPSMEKIKINDKNAFIVPMHSGIPQFFPYLKKHSPGILITDAQENGFTEILKEREKFPGIRIKKTAFPQGNLAIIGAESGPAYQGKKININFNILNKYKEKKKTRSTLKLDGKVFMEKNKILKVGESDLSFNLSLPRGLHQLSLELEDKKGFNFDNKYYLTVNVRAKQNIYILSDDYPERLIAALPPSYFEVKWVRGTSEIKGNLFIANNVDKKSGLSLLKNPISGIICLRGAENTSISNKIPDRISTVVEESSFNNSSDLKALSQIPISYNCIITDGKTLMYFENGNPFVSKIKNHLILPTSLEENDLSLHPVFIPFLFNLINSLSEEPFCSNILLDEPIVITNFLKPTIISPKGNEYTGDPVNADNYIFKETKECGIYKITDGNKIIGLIAVNNHPSESKLESLSDKELRYIFGRSGLTNGASFFLILALLCFILSLFIERRR